MEQAIELVEERIEVVENDLRDAERQYDNPDCPHCDQEMAVGAMSGSEIKYGCYPPTGEGKEARQNYDCPFYQQHGYAYSRKIRLKDVESLKAQLRELEALKRQMVREFGAETDKGDD